LATPDSPAPLITLTTDFGSRDPYVASMKGVLLSLNPALRIVDISHEIAPQQIVEAGFVLACAFPSFPQGTLHILVVDPGVGTSRRLLLARTENHIFLAPDNGALGIVFEHEPAREVFSITASHYFRKGSGATFDGRDILAPVAAAAAGGTALANFGEPVTDWVPSPLPPCTLEAPGRVRIQVVHVDRFGNIIFNFRENQFTKMAAGANAPSFHLEMAGRSVDHLLRTYGEAPSTDPFALFNSSGYLELAVRNASAARTLSARPGDSALLFL